MSLAGFGFGARDFIGYGETRYCEHCHNQVVEEIYVNYNYEEALHIRIKTYLGMVVLCPICNYGFSVGADSVNLEYAEKEKKRLAKKEGAAASATFGAKFAREQDAFQSRFNIPETSAWVSKLNPLAKVLYFKAMRRLGLFKVISSVGG
jgi:hypothetical protein